MAHTNNLFQCPLDFSKLIHGQRYLFHYKNNKQINQTFRANFLGIHYYKEYSTIMLNKYETNNYPLNKSEIWYMNPKSILKTESLSNILGNKFKLHDDILFEIDNYL